MTRDGQQNLFTQWNVALLRAFFSPAQKDELVVLAVGRDELNNLAPELGGYLGLLEAVREGPPGLAQGTWRGAVGYLVGWALRLKSLRTMRLDARPGAYIDPAALLPYGGPNDRMPTYLPLLAALVAVFTEYGEGGFYEHLKNALKLPDHWGTREHGDLVQLWDDLEAWTGVLETSGRYGRFQAVKLGEQPYVGYLRAQGIFRTTDIERLGRIFATIGLRPGQPIEEAVVDRVLERIAGERTLSSGLCKAAGLPEYRAVLRERLVEFLEDWDGGWSDARDAHGSAGGREDDTDLSSQEAQVASREVGLTLHLTGDALPWRIGWRLRDIPDIGTFELVDSSERRWNAGPSGDAEVIALPPVEGQETGDVLEEARERREDGLVLTIAPTPDNGADIGLVGSFVFRHQILRYLVYRESVGCLVERDGLPMHGPAYLLRSPDNHNFLPVVQANDVQLVACPANGLPRGWELWHIQDCAFISDEQRRLLPDGLEVRPRAHCLRLVGGVRFHRAGHLMFLPYDLPLVELDAPPDTQLEADGLDLHPEPSTAHPAGELRPTTIRRHRVRIRDDSRQRFAIEARDPANRVFARLTLRLASSDAPRLADGACAGLDASGSSSSLKPNLVGMLLEGWEGSDRHPSRRIVSLSCLGRELDDVWLSRGARDVAEVQFLDSLAQPSAVAIRYGDARDRLQNYLRASGRTEPASRLLRALRRRGLVEILTDSRGRWSAVAKVPPTLYLLPIEAAGREVWGVAGTLSIHHWASLRELDAELWWEHDHATRLRVIRVVGSLSGAVMGDFSVTRRPCTAIALFSDSLRERREALSRHGFEDLGKQVGKRDFFSPMSMEWVQHPTEAHWLLLRYTDPDTGVHQLHSLRSEFGGSRRYRHVRDERWGIWVAHTACTQWLKDRIDLHDIVPWPLHYDRSSWTLWLPARMSLPYVLERALLAAGGGPPMETRLTGKRSPASDVVVAENEFDSPVGSFHSCYTPLLPEQEKRIWLQYRWVPPELAEVIAMKLECRLEAFPYVAERGER